MIANKNAITTRAMVVISERSTLGALLTDVKIGVGLGEAEVEGVGVCVEVGFKVGSSVGVGVFGVYEALGIVTVWVLVHPLA